MESLLALLRFCSAAFGLLIIVGILELFYVIADETRFRAARAYIYLKMPQLRLAFLVLMTGVILELIGGALMMLALMDALQREEIALAVNTAAHLTVFLSLQLLYYIFSGKI